MRMRVPVFLVVVLLSFSAHAAIDPATAAVEYARLQKWQFSAPIPLPAQGLTFTRDTATWTLESGTVRMMEPLDDGTVTGVFFEGKGRFRMTIPDRYELAQLRRFTGKPALETIDQPITQLLLRTSDPALAALFPAGAGPYAPYGPAVKRHESWLIDLRNDADAHVLAALLNPGALEILAGMQTQDYDWITYEYDSTRDEEISLTQFRAILQERWVSLDASEQRQPDGRPGPASSAAATLDHIDVKADLTRNGSTPGASRHQQRAINGIYSVEETLTGLADSVRALRLGLASRAKSFKAFAPDGTELTVFRDHVGKRAAALDDRVWDDDFVVVLHAPLRRGEQQRVRFDYELETANYAPGGLWYPVFRDTPPQKHTGRLQLTVRKRNELRSMGRMVERTAGDRDTDTSVWVVDRPTKMLTFSTATRFEEVRVPAEGVPTVIAFGPDYQFANTAKTRNVGVDVANSMYFFQNLFDDRISGDTFYVTSIAAAHGQAFEGFLHMGEFTFASDRAGASELFRAHEVAHEWWGHKVGWIGYRDQWLSESLAEYSAMLFVQRTVHGGQGFFEEILRAYDGIVLGNLEGGFSKFNRPSLIERNVAERNRLGPIAHGFRASTRDIPLGYVVQTYHKGPLVLHMMRMLLLYRTGSDDAFTGILRDFVHEYSGRNASTEDFRRVVEHRTASDWGWFFDAWIYRAAIPSYRWRYDVKPDGDGYALTLNVDRRNVDPAVALVLPVRVDLENGKTMMMFAINNEPKQSITERFPSRPKSVVFAPDNSLLATVRRD